MGVHNFAIRANSIDNVYWKLQKISERINGNSRKALLSFFVSIILNIVCGVLASIIASKLF